MRKIVLIALILVGIFGIVSIAYSFCMGPPFGCTNCPTCGAIGTVFYKKEVGSGFSKTCLYYLKCWQGHVWNCAS